MPADKTFSVFWLLAPGFWLLPMDLTSSLSNLQQSQTMGQVQIAVAAKIMNMQRLEGNAAVQLIDAASKGVSKAGDQLVAAATGLGGQIDTYG